MMTGPMNKYTFKEYKMTTRLKVQNNTPDPKTVYITLGATVGCVQDVVNIQVDNGVTITRLFALQGYFVLPSLMTVELTAPDGRGFNGNFSIGTPPLNCPTAEFPQGVNLAEFIINNGFQDNGQETVDISCVCGANAFLEMHMDAYDWTTQSGSVLVNAIANATCYNNTGLIGVFPYGCDNCTSSDNPPECVGKHPEYANQTPICNVQRPAIANQGGTVLVKIMGMIPAF